MVWANPDPSPDADLPSDVTFGTWLSTLDPVQVLYDLERVMAGDDRYRLAYLRHRLVAQQKKDTL